MENEKNPNNSENTKEYDKILHSWEVPEFDKHKRSTRWYVLAILGGILLLVFASFTDNFTFAVIILLSALIIIIHDGQEPMKVQFLITDEGVVIGRKFYDYDELKNFSIVYKPNEGVKNLYFEFKNVLKPRLSIPLNDMDPLPIRENLLKYLEEDLERTDRPLSEELAHFFKL